MARLRADQQKLISSTVFEITKEFEEKLAKAITERDVALLVKLRKTGEGEDLSPLLTCYLSC